MRTDCDFTTALSLVNSWCIPFIDKDGTDETIQQLRNARMEHAEPLVESAMLLHRVAAQKIEVDAYRFEQAGRVNQIIQRTLEILTDESLITHCPVRLRDTSSRMLQKVRQELEQIDSVRQQVEEGQEAEETQASPPAVEEEVLTPLSSRSITFQTAKKCITDLFCNVKDLLCEIFGNFWFGLSSSFSTSVSLIIEGGIKRSDNLIRAVSGLFFVPPVLLLSGFFLGGVVVPVLRVFASLRSFFGLFYPPFWILGTSYPSGKLTSLYTPNLLVIEKTWKSLDSWKKRWINSLSE